MSAGGSGRRLRSLPRKQALALLGLAMLLVCGFAVVAAMALALGERRAEAKAARATAGQLQLRLAVKTAASAPGIGAREPPGSSWLEAETATVAAAALQRRVAAAIAAAGGNVLASQTDLAEAAAAEPRIALTVTCELADAALQALLYDLEAGKPMLFIHAAQMHMRPAREGEAAAALQLVLTVQAYWRKLEP